MQYQFGTAVRLVLIALPSPVLAQSQTKTYEYDALGRLVEVTIIGGSQDGEQRDYTYDEADNRTRVVSIAPPETPTPTPTPTPSPTSCALDQDFTTTASGVAYPRVRAPAGGCTFPVQLAYSITVDSGSGLYTDWIGNGGLLNAGDAVRTMGIKPEETTISGGGPSCELSPEDFTTTAS